jgi:LysM domain
MADGAPDERQCIGSINRALKRYGSTCNHVKRLPSDGCVRAVIRHEIEEGDTLQGLALKYGTTVRQLSRREPFNFLGPFTPKTSRFSL